jgi:AbrB family looped-hinge helix DNA binding protein
MCIFVVINYNGMETSVLTSKGQLLIPKRIRNKYGIKSGVKIAFIDSPEGLVIKPMDEAYFESFAGKFKDAMPSTKEYLKIKKQEIKLEEEKINRIYKTSSKSK